MLTRLMLITLLCLLFGSPASAGVSFDLSTATASSGDLNAVSPGDTITVEVRMRSDGTLVFGLGAAVEFDESAFSLTSGETVIGYLFELCFPSAGCFNGLDNLVMNPLEQVGGRVQFANSASLTGRAGTGATDPGIGGEDGLHARIVLEVLAGATSGEYTITAGTNPATGNVIVLAGGATEPATANGSFAVTINGIPPSPSYSNEVLADLPVAYWPLDDLGTPVLDVVGTRPGYLLAGSVTATDDTAIDNLLGGSFLSGPSGAMLLSPFDPAMNTPTFSIEAWVKFSSNCTAGTGGEGFCSIARAAQPMLNTGYGIGAVDTLPELSLGFFLNDGAATPSDYWLTRPDVLLDRWYHVVGTFDGTTQRLFTNGVEYASQPASFTPNGFAPFELFGSDADVLENGSIDEVAYYDYALSSERVLQHYTAGLGMVCEAIGALAPSSSALGPRQNNYCEDWAGVSQTGSDISGTILAMANLAGAFLSGVDLSGASLRGADISDGVLVLSNLQSADLAGANLFSTYVIGTDFTGADMTDVILSEAVYNENTIFPTGNAWDTPPYGLPGDATPWALGMIPTPEPGLATGLVAGLASIAVLGRRRHRPGSAGAAA